MITKNPRSNLPPGFRFHPTDEELILHYLRKKIQLSPVPVSIIADVDIYKFDPWELPAKAPCGEKEWYFFSPRDRKYPNGVRPNRAAASGYWKATGTDKIITTIIGNRFQENIGVKKALVFYKGKPPKGIKTNWIMHEYRLSETLNSNKIIYNNNNSISDHNIGVRGLKYYNGSSMRLDDWVLCRIYNKPHTSSSSSSSAMIASTITNQEHEEDEELVSTQKTLSPKLANNDSLKPQKSCSFSNLLEAVDLSFFSNFLSENPENQTEVELPSMIDFTNPNHTMCTSYGSYKNDDYLDQKLPQLSNLPMENDRFINNKRQRSGFDEGMMNVPSKKKMIHQSTFLNQEFLNQQLFLSSHLQFQR